MTKRLHPDQFKQLIWLAYFHLRAQKNGLIPTTAEIAAFLGNEWRGQTNTRINDLVAEGWFSRHEKLARTLTPLRLATDVYAELDEVSLAIWQNAIEGCKTSISELD